MQAARRTLAIVNPVSAGGRTGRNWPAISRLLREQTDFEVQFSQFAGHAVELGNQARLRGFERVLCVGGDGTLNEVINGLFLQDRSTLAPEIGVIPGGTGADFARTLGIPHDPGQACRLLASAVGRRCDLGVVSYIGDAGITSRLFVNAAGVGYDAEVVSRKNSYNRYVSGTLPYLASVAATLLSYRNKDVRISVDQKEDTRRVNAVVLAIGEYFGGGMRVAPNAKLDDGAFDVITLGDLGKLDLVRNVPRIYNGSHLSHPKVREERARLVRIDSSVPMLVQADGELIGRAPATFEIRPGAFTVLC